MAACGPQPNPADASLPSHRITIPENAWSERSSPVEEAGSSREWDHADAWQCAKKPAIHPFHRIRLFSKSILSAVHTHMVWSFLDPKPGIPWKQHADWAAWGEHVCTGGISGLKLVFWFPFWGVVVEIRTHYHLCMEQWECFLVKYLLISQVFFTLIQAENSILSQNLLLYTSSETLLNFHSTLL